MPEAWTTPVSPETCLPATAGVARQRTALALPKTRSHDPTLARSTLTEMGPPFGLRGSVLSIGSNGRRLSARGKGSARC